MQRQRPTAGATAQTSLSALEQAAASADRQHQRLVQQADAAAQRVRSLEHHATLLRQRLHELQLSEQGSRADNAIIKDVLERMAAKLAQIKRAEDGMRAVVDATTRTFKDAKAVHEMLREESATAAKTADALKADVAAAQALATRAAASKTAAHAAFTERQASLAERDSAVVALFQRLRLEADATASMQLQLDQEKQRVADLKAKLAAADEAYAEGVKRACAPAALRLQRAKDAVAAFQQRISVRAEEWESTRITAQMRLDDTRARVATLVTLREHVTTTTQLRTHNSRVRAALQASAAARSDAQSKIADATRAVEKATSLPGAISATDAEADTTRLQAREMHSQQRLAEALTHTQQQADAVIIAQLRQLQQQAAGAMVETAAYEDKCTAILQAVADNVATACVQRLAELDSVAAAATAAGHADASVDAASVAGMGACDDAGGSGDSSGQALATAMQVLHGQLSTLVQTVGAARAVAGEAQTLYDAAGAGLSAVDGGDAAAAGLEAPQVQRIRAALAASASLQLRLRAATAAVIEAATALTPSAAGIRDVITALNCRSHAMQTAVEALQEEVVVKTQERDLLLSLLQDVQTACAATANVDQKMAELTLAHEEHRVEASATWRAKKEKAQAAHAARLAELQAATAAAKAQADKSAAQIRRLEATNKSTSNDGADTPAGAARRSVSASAQPRASPAAGASGGGAGRESVASRKSGLTSVLQSLGSGSAHRRSVSTTATEHREASSRRLSQVSSDVSDESAHDDGAGQENAVGGVKRPASTSPFTLRKTTGGPGSSKKPDGASSAVEAVAGGTGRASVAASRTPAARTVTFDTPDDAQHRTMARAAPAATADRADVDGDDAFDRLSSMVSSGRAGLASKKKTADRVAAAASVASASVASASTAVGAGRVVGAGSVSSGDDAMSIDMSFAKTLASGPQPPAAAVSKGAKSPAAVMSAARQQQTQHQSRASARFFMDEDSDDASDAGSDEVVPARAAPAQPLRGRAPAAPALTPAARPAAPAASVAKPSSSMAAGRVTPSALGSIRSFSSRNFAHFHDDVSFADMELMPQLPRPGAAGAASGGLRRVTPAAPAAAATTTPAPPRMAASSSRGTSGDVTARQFAGGAHSQRAMSAGPSRPSSGGPAAGGIARSATRAPAATASRSAGAAGSGAWSPTSQRSSVSTGLFSDGLF